MAKTRTGIIQVEYAKPNFWGADYPGALHYPDRRKDGEYVEWEKHATEVGNILLGGLHKQVPHPAAMGYFACLGRPLVDDGDVRDGMVDKLLALIGKSRRGEIDHDNKKFIAKRAVVNMSAGIIRSPQRILNAGNMSPAAFDELMDSLSSLVDDDILFVRAGGGWQNNAEIDTGQVGVVSAGMGNVISVVAGGPDGVGDWGANSDFAADICTDSTVPGLSSFAAPRVAVYARALMDEFSLPSHFIKAALIAAAVPPVAWEHDKAAIRNKAGFRFHQRGGAGYLEIPDSPREYPETPAWKLLKQWRGQGRSLPTIDHEHWNEPVQFEHQGWQGASQWLELYFPRALNPMNVMLELYATDGHGRAVDGRQMEIVLVSPENTRIQLKRKGTAFSKGSMCTSAFLGELASGNWRLEVRGCPGECQMEANLRVSGVVMDAHLSHKIFNEQARLEARKKTGNYVHS